MVLNKAKILVVTSSERSAFFFLENRLVFSFLDGYTHHSSSEGAIASRVELRELL